MTTFWAKVPQFQDVTADNTLVLEPYLQAAEGATTIFALFGAAFSPLKTDMMGNIKKLRLRNETDKEKFTSVNAILQDEKDNKTSKEGQTGALWLTRALVFIEKLLIHLVDSVRKEPNEEKFRPIFLKAYDETLKPYHGMITKTLVSTVSRAAPNRPEMMKKLALDQEGMDEQVIKDIEAYLVNLTKTNELAVKILKDNGFYSQEAV